MSEPTMREEFEILKNEWYNSRAGQKIDMQEAGYILDQILSRDPIPSPDAGLRDVFSEIKKELDKAQTKHAPMHGPHEGYAVILEEVDELWDEVRAQKHDISSMKKEALHIAAMAARFVLDLCQELPHE